jgi:hypothetical protein
MSKKTSPQTTNTMNSTVASEITEVVGYLGKYGNGLEKRLENEEIL